ncbi:unnamed protein product, partial [Allacma fusca]
TESYKIPTAHLAQSKLQQLQLHLSDVRDLWRILQCLQQQPMQADLH